MRALSTSDGRSDRVADSRDDIWNIRSGYRNAYSNDSHPGTHIPGGIDFSHNNRQSVSQSVAVR